MSGWDEKKHPRAPAGKSGGGEFRPIGGMTAGGTREPTWQEKRVGRKPAPTGHTVTVPGQPLTGTAAQIAKAASRVRDQAHVLGTNPDRYTRAAGASLDKAAVAWQAGRRDLAAQHLQQAQNSLEQHAAAPGGRRHPLYDEVRRLAAAAGGTPGASRALTHEPLGKPGGPGLWGMKGAQLPAFIQHMRNDIMQERGMPEDAATPIAISQCRKLAAKGNAQAMAAMAEFERLQAKAKATRSEPRMSGYDPNGLDSSWDDVSGLPDLTGLGVPEFEAAETSLGWQPPPAPPAARAAKLGSGGRFEALSAELGSRGAQNPDALAAWIGRRKYGKGKFGQLATAARKKAPAAAARSGHIVRFCPIEDIHILRTGEGDHTGRVVEAYAAVFDQPAVIHDAQGHYEETIDRGAFDQVLARIHRSRGGLAAAVRVLYNHGKTIEGLPAPEFQRPIAKPLEVRPDGRGLITRSEYKKSQFAEEILDDIREGRITAQSFEGGIYRSDPELRGPGDRYRRRNGVLPRVRRLAVGLLNYGPALFAAYSGAEFLGVRMQLPDALLAEDEGEPYTEDEENPPDEGGVAGGTPGEVHPSRDHAHRLLAMRTEEMCREAGMSVLRRTWES